MSMVSKDVYCPYCATPQDIRHDDGYGYSESEIHQQFCWECQNRFNFSTSVHFRYEVSKIEDTTHE